MNSRTIDMTGLLKEFQEFWRDNSEAWTDRIQYKEAAPHLILMGFLQRVVNGGAKLPWEQRLFRETVERDGRIIHVMGA